MKKVLAVAAITATMLAVGTGAYAATYVNGEDVTNEVFTTISNDYTLFPVRYLGEKLGCDVSWNPNDKCISVSKGDIHRDFYNGSAAVYDWNGNSYNLVTAPKLVDGNTMVPAEFYRDNFGVSVIWDDVTSSLFINSEDTYNWLINTNEYQNAKWRKESKAMYEQYIGTYTYTPSGDYRPLIELNITEANSEYIVANAHRLHGKGFEYNIGKAKIVDMTVAETYGTFDWQYNGMSIQKKYRFHLNDYCVVMDIYDTDNNLEDSYTFFKN